jgi:probable rRNA maturation factor
MIINRQRRIPVPVAPLEAFLARVCARLELPGDAVAVCLVGDVAMARWNETYRGKSGATDVLSFPANGNARKLRRRARRGKLAKSRRGQSGSPPFSDSLYLGDIAISPETARRNGRRFHRTLPEELRILILHGVLHLLGYDHETDRGQMERLERRLRRELGLR